MSTSNKNLKRLMNRLVKHADLPEWSNMGMRAGEGAERARVTWRRYNAGSQANLVQGGPLPDEIANLLQGKINDFKSEFEQFAKNQQGEVKRKYAGMIFAYYAADMTGNDYPSRINKLPNYLQETLRFVRQNNIILPTLSESTEKGIGSAKFMSYNGHAWDEYASQKGLGNIGVGRPTQHREVRLYNPKRDNNSDRTYGPLRITEAPSGGAGLFIDTSHMNEGDGDVYTQNPMIPALTPETGKTARQKFFEEGDLDPLSGHVKLPNGPEGNEAEAAKKPNIGKYYQREGRRLMTDEAGNPIPKDGLSKHEQEMAQRELERYYKNRNAHEEGSLYQMKLQPDGGIMLRHTQSGNEFPMKPEQLRSIVSEGYLKNNIMLSVKPEAEAEGQTEATGNFGPFEASEQLMRDLSSEDGMGYFRIQGATGPGRGTNRSPYSFESLRELQHFLGGGRASTNSYRLAVIGPQFSNALNLGEGNAVANNPNVIDPNKATDPGTDSLIVERGTRWGFYMMNAAPERTQAQGARGSRTWREIGKATETIQEAFSKLQNEAAKADPDADISVIGEDAARIAQQALESAQQMPMNIEEPLPEQEQEQQEPEQPVQEPEPDQKPNTIDWVDNDRNATVSLRRMMRKISRK